MFIKVKNNLFW